MEQLKFSVYEHKIECNGKLVRKNFIVLKDQDSLIYSWTDLSNYVSIKKRFRPLSDSNLQRCQTIVMFLNYLFFEKQSVNSLSDISPDHVKQFLFDYANKNTGNHANKISRQKSTVKVRSEHIFDFIKVLAKEKMLTGNNENDFFEVVEVFNSKTGRMCKKINPCFDIYYIDEDKQIFRDMPQSVMEIILNHVIRKHKNILMLFALCVFAGLRPAEACNVRRADSKLGPGLLFEIVNDEVVNIKIDLSKETNLRSDLVSVGDIKKERIQVVCPAFITPFCKCYEIYMKYINGHKYELEYGPLSIDSRGKAITYNNFYKQFKTVIKEIIPELLTSDDSELVNYGLLLQETNISPHILRHYFSCRLAVMGCSVAELMTYRGDKSPESSLHYLLNKSDLEKQLRKVNEKSFEFNLWKASKKQ